MTYHNPKTMVPSDPTNVEDRPIYLAQELTQDGQLAHICHLGKVYTLRITRNGKLILTK